MIELVFKQCLLLYFKLLLIKVWQKCVFRKYSSFIQNYQQLEGFRELQYIGLLLNLQGITTSKDLNNYNMQIYKMIYKEQQFEKW